MVEDDDELDDELEDELDDELDDEEVDDDEVLVELPPPQATSARLEPRRSR